ncbi:hypothetical protein PIB30_067922 [Stylosanthes scabra]|uniref:tRNA:m(4)X modification enzyme TRM13 n=1 Tax=Stylosanthes scabra TaxID=79078 RepID=A0ABU6SNR2_9FABA|nr:hypothetical protein [Stylosanthes scabra]
METTKRCNFWLPNKKRFCANSPIGDSLYCGNHTSRSQGQWIPCPIDPSHSVLEENLKGHVNRCPLLKQVQSLSRHPFYRKGINTGSDGEQEEEEGLPAKTISSEMKRNALHSMSVPEFCNLLEKIESIHESLCKDIQESFQMPEVCRLWIKTGEEDRKLPFQEKHIMQQASILGNLENFGILKSSFNRKVSECEEPDKQESSVPAVVEFGAGRGYLTQMLADCYGIKSVFLVERRSYKLKADRSLRQNESLRLERLRIDIEDLDLTAVESLHGVPFLAIGKHLCGAATDKRYFLDLGMTKEEFHAITWFTSWAVDANHGSDLPDATDFRSDFQSIKEQGDGYANGVEKILAEMEAPKRAALGFKCKWIIDVGRLMWLRELGFDAKLVKYVPTTLSPENHLLIARPANYW